MTVNDLIQSRSISRHVYRNAKILVWAAYAYGIYWLSVGGHWGDVWGIMTMTTTPPLEPTNGNRCPCPHILSMFIWAGMMVGTISSIVSAALSVRDGEFATQWGRMTETCKGKNISVFLGIILGIFYVILVPFLLLTTIFYGILLFLSMEWIPGD